jgi:hypothetical protein
MISMAIFRGTMVRHSFVAHRDAKRGGAEDVTFSGDAWLRYVPIRATDAVCVRENLPPGTAAVLLNTSQSHTDLVLPIDVHERCLFEACDGRVTIAELLQSRSSSEPDHDFFHRLYLNDLIVFDTSR